MPMLDLLPLLDWSSTWEGCNSSSVLDAPAFLGQIVAVAYNENCSITEVAQSVEVC